MGRRALRIAPGIKMNSSGCFGMGCHQGLSFSGLFMRCDRAEAVFWPGCALMNLDPDILYKTAAVLKRTEPELGLCSGCCGQPTRYLFHEKHSARRDRLLSLLRQRGVKRIYTACPNCMVQMREADGIEVIPIWRALAENIRAEDIKGLECPLTLHDPCPMRSETEQQYAVRKLLRLCGAEVREAENSGGRTLCCGNYHMMRATDPGKSAAMRQRRISQFRKDTAVASYCEGCLDAFRSEGLETVHVLEALFDKSKRRGWGNRIRFTLGIGR